MKSLVKVIEGVFDVSTSDIDSISAISMYETPGSSWRTTFGESGKFEDCQLKAEISDGVLTLIPHGIDTWRCTIDNDIDWPGDPTSLYFYGGLNWTFKWPELTNNNINLNKISATSCMELIVDRVRNIELNSPLIALHKTTEMNDCVIKTGCLFIGNATGEVPVFKNCTGEIGRLSILMNGRNMKTGRIFRNMCKIWDEKYPIRAYSYNRNWTYGQFLDYVLKSMKAKDGWGFSGEPVFNLKPGSKLKDVIDISNLNVKMIELISNQYSIVFVKKDFFRAEYLRSNLSALSISHNNSIRASFFNNVIGLYCEDHKQNYDYFLYDRLPETSDGYKVMIL